MLSTSKLILVLGISVLTLTFILDFKVYAIPVPDPEPCGEEWGMHPMYPPYQHKPEKYSQHDMPTMQHTTDEPGPIQDKKQKLQQLKQDIENLFDETWMPQRFGHYELEFPTGAAHNDIHNHEDMHPAHNHDEASHATHNHEATHDMTESSTDMTLDNIIAKYLEFIKFLFML